MKQGWISFQASRWRGDETALSRWSAFDCDIRAEAVARTIALVGNARSLCNGTQGAQIDAADLVVRLNRAARPDRRSHGTRTDWLFTSVPLGRDAFMAHPARRLFWATSKRKHLPWALARDPRFVLTPAKMSFALMRELGARPSTGIIALSYLLTLPVARVTLHGFDFFASLSTSGQRSAEQVPHDFTAERRLVMQLAAQDDRLLIVPTPSGAAPVPALAPRTAPVRLVAELSA